MYNIMKACYLGPKRRVGSDTEIDLLSIMQGGTVLNIHKPLWSQLLELGYAYDTV
jgi:hypothetical protein